MVDGAPSGRFGLPRPPGRSGGSSLPVGRRAFGLKPEFAQESAALAANQGLYNGFLAAGLVWGLVAGGSTGFQAKVFFLVCVLVAGVYGAITANRRILFVQAVPAAIGLVLVVLAR